MENQGRSAPSHPAFAAPKRKGTAGIWVGVGLVLGGIVLGIGLIVAGAGSIVSGVDDLERVPVGSGGTVQVEHAGAVKVYGERNVPGSSPSSFSSSTSSGPVPDVEVEILDPEGDPVQVRPVPGSEEYQSDGHWGTRIGRFDADQTGTYTVEVVGGSDVSRYDTIAVGDSIRPRGLWLIVAGILGGALLVLVGTILIIVFAVRRSRAAKRTRQGGGPFPMGGHGAPQPGWPAAPGYPPHPPPAGPTPGWPPPPGRTA